MEIYAAKIPHWFASAEEGRERLLANTEYYSQLTQTDMNFRLGHENATLDELLERSTAEIKNYNNIDRLSVVQATLSELGGGQIMLGDKPLHIPKGTVLLSAQNASDYYKAKAAQVFSDFLDGYIDEACSGRG